MTTVCYDGEYIAADSLVNEGGVVVDLNYEKIKTFEGKYRGENIVAIAICGSLEYLQKIQDELVKDDPKFPEAEDYVAWIVTDKAFWEVYGTGVYKVTAKVNAMGSGSKFARSALSLGKSAKEAVKHAAKFDVYTGGKIRVIKVREVKKKRVIQKAPKKGKLSRKQIKKAVENVSAMTYQERMALY